MKYLLLSIFVMLAAPPLQASFCEMCADESNSHQAMSDFESHVDSIQIVGHSMVHGPDNSAGMSMDHSGDNQSMDCCDDQSTSSEDGCSAMTHCGASTASMALFEYVISTTWLSAYKGQTQALSQVPPNQFSSPPFRPPIS